MESYLKVIWQMIYQELFQQISEEIKTSLHNDSDNEDKFNLLDADKLDPIADKRRKRIEEAKVDFDGTDSDTEDIFAKVQISL